MKKLNPLFPFVLITCLVFVASCITKEVQTTETYYETEYRSEPYVEIGKEHKENLTRTWTRNAPIYFSELEWAKAGSESFIDGYEIDTAQLSKSQAKLILSSSPQAGLWGIVVIDVTGLGPISEPPPQSASAHEEMVEGEMVYTPPPGEQKWIDDLEAITMDPERHLCFIRSEEQTGLDIMVDVTGVEQFAVITTVPWDAPRVVQKVQLIWSEEVTGDKLVPYQVMKQRTVTQTEKVPFWEIISSQ